MTPRAEEKKQDIPRYCASQVQRPAARVLLIYLIPAGRCRQVERQQVADLDLEHGAILRAILNDGRNRTRNVARLLDAEHGDGLRCEMQR